MPALSQPVDATRPRAVVPQQQLRDALANDELELHYQPIVDLTTGGIRGVEALLRWRVAGGMLMPDDFLPAVAHTPAMRDLTGWVIDAACAQASRWPTWSVSVNVAPIDVVRLDLVDVVTGALARHAVEPARLVLELTEHAAVQAMDTASEVLRRLRALGVGIALDDFGTGYSSLLYLRDLPITEVKIDRTFVAGVQRLDDDAAIVESVVRLAGNVGLDVVAEGVENTKQVRFLRNIGCTFAQGYLYAVPTPAEDVASEFAAHHVPTQSHRSQGSRRPRRGASPDDSGTLPQPVQARITALSADGASLHTIAAALNHDGMKTISGTRWTAATVARALRDTH